MRAMGPRFWPTVAFVGVSLTARLFRAALTNGLRRWLGPGNRVMGMTRVQIPTRRDEGGAERKATIPDHVEVLYELQNGAPVHMKFSETTGLSPGNQIWLHGSEGTIFVDNEQKIFVGKRGDTALAELPNPREQQAAQMARRADAGRRHVERGRSGLCELDELPDRSCRYRRVEHHHARRRRDQRDGHELGDDVVRQLLV